MTKNQKNRVNNIGIILGLFSLIISILAVYFSYQSNEITKALSQPSLALVPMITEEQYGIYATSLTDHPGLISSFQITYTNVKNIKQSFDTTLEFKKHIDTLNIAPECFVFGMYGKDIVFSKHDVSMPVIALSPLYL